MKIFNGFWANDFQLGLFACSQPAGIYQAFAQTIKYGHLLNTINNWSTANVFICRSSINRPNSMYLLKKSFLTIFVVCILHVQEK